nr:Orphan Rhodopsin-like G protein-coupled receptor [Hymenolepis microstoma]
MAEKLGWVEIADLMLKYYDLPMVSDISKMTADSYYDTAKSLKKYCSPDFLKEAQDYPKFGDWCRYISRFNTCSIAPHPNDFFGRTLISTSNNTTPVTTISPVTASPCNTPVFRNLTDCYDDYFCGRDWGGSLLFGIVFVLLCSAGLLLNFACMVGFNKATNRCGATLYFTVIALLDCLYLALKLPLKAAVHLNGVSFSDQTTAYAQRAAYLVPVAVPFTVFFEVASVWLTVCLLMERYLYLRRGYFSRSVTSVGRHVRIISVVLLLSFCYIIPRFFEFRSVPNSEIPNGYKVVYTSMGNSSVYRSLVDYLLNIPIEMFLPYLGFGMLTSMAVSKMVDLGSSKWKTVTSLCSYSNYCCCGDDFANCYPFTKAKKNHHSDVIDEPDPEIPNNPTSDNLDNPSPPTIEDKRLPKVSIAGNHQVFYCGIPFEKRSDLMPFYFLVPPPRQTLKETANVVITVCLGFLLLITKIPKLILLALELEKYVELNPVYTEMAIECLNVTCIVLKPMIYLMFGVHFRHALTGLCCCACLYTPVIHGNGSTDRKGPREREGEAEGESMMGEME